MQSSTCDSGTLPSNGQPNAVAIAPIIPTSLPRSAASTSVKPANDSSTLRRTLARLCVSDAETTSTTSSTFAASARSAPRAFGTSAASRSCGTAFGETNEVASILATPVCERRSMISILRSVGIQFGSIWKPSRATTSWINTRCFIVVAPAQAGAQGKSLKLDPGLRRDDLSYRSCRAQPRDVLVAVADPAQHFVGVLSEPGADPLHRAGCVRELRHDTR